VFSPASQAGFDQLVVALSSAVRRACPGATEMVLTHGRTRRLVELRTTAAGGAANGATASAPILFKPRPLKALASIGAIEGKCEALLEWLRRTDIEYPEKLPATRSVAPELLSVFHDGDFVPLFGRAFDAATADWKAGVHRDVIGRCQGLASVNRVLQWLGDPDPTRKGMTTYAEAFRRYELLLDGAFLGRGLDTAAVAATVVEARESARWLQEAARSLYALGISEEAFETLQDVPPEAAEELANLWPSQREEFAATLSHRLEQVASGQVDRWIARLNQATGGLATAVTLAEGRRAQERALRLSSKEKQEAESAAYAGRIEHLLSADLAGRLAALEAVPATLVGARQLANWRRSIATEIGPLSESLAESTLEKAEAQRNRVFGGAWPEWVKLVNDGATSVESRGPLTEALDALFPLDVRDNDPAFSTFERALSTALFDVEQRVYTAALEPCDRFAAHPDDAEGSGRGVRDAQMNPTDAIAACEDATKSEEAATRHFFQLGRGYLRAGRIEDAIDALLIAAEDGHGGALGYLGDIHLDGAPGVDADPEVAHDLYQRAVEAGFKPAAAVLKGFEDYSVKVAEAETLEREALAVDGVTFTQPDIVEHVLAGDFDAVRSGELHTKAHLVGMAETIVEECSAHFTTTEVELFKLDTVTKVIDLGPAGGQTVLMAMLTEYASIEQDPIGYFSRLASASPNEEVPIQGMKDAFALMAVHPCKSPGLTTFATNVRTYFNGGDSRPLSSAEMTRICEANARTQGRYDAANFCQCFVPSLITHPVSRVQRKRLASDFWPTAQEIMAENPQRFSVCVNGPRR